MDHIIADHTNLLDGEHGLLDFDCKDFEDVGITADCLLHEGKESPNGFNAGEGL